MNVSIRKMGNSAGVIIPKALLAMLEVESGDELEMSLQGSRLILTPVNHDPRAGWAEAAQAIAEAGDDQLVWPEFANEADKDWEW